MMIKQYQILTNLSCNLDCSYCYEKKINKVNNFSDIKEFLLLMMERDKNTTQTLAIDYIGGESLLVVELLEKTNDFLLTHMEKFGFKYAKFFHSTNGTLFKNKKVQKYMLKYKNGGYYGISIDGTKAIHDKNRVYKKDGIGSYDDIIKGLDWVKANIGTCKLNLKATYTKDTFKHYFEGVKSLIKLGISNINANLIFEDSFPKEWAKSASLTMIKLVDYLIDNNLQKKVNLTHLLEDGNFLTPSYDFNSFNSFKKTTQNWCGTCTHMICLGFDKKLYGCNRFLTMKKPDKEIGIIENGKIVYTNQKLKEEVSKQFQLMPKECKACPIQTVCSSCVAIAYEEDDMSIKDYLAQKKQCGWTWAKAIACEYANLRIKNV